jgi:glycosyltransferase involved in cell wall biosynthesis
MKVAVITPYHSEPLDWIQAAVESVAAQSHPTTHILVGDGVRQEALDGDGRIHMTLPHTVADSGGTPRAIAGRWAVAQGFDMVAYLDADDRIDPDFVSTLVRARERLGAEVISVPHAYFDLTMRPARNLMGQHIGI